MENLVGFLLPPIVELANKDIKNENEKLVVSILVCFVAACIINWHQITIGNVSGLIASLVICFAESELLFKLYWKNSFPRSWLQAKFNGMGDTTGSTEQG